MRAFAATCWQLTACATAAWRSTCRRLGLAAIWLVSVFTLCTGAAQATPGIPGTLDPFFATGSALGPGRFLQSLTGNSDYVSALLLQPDGKLVLAGYCSVRFCALRLNPDGTLDTTFNTTGMVVLPAISSYDAANGAVVQPDGKLVIVGDCTVSGGYDMCVARLNVDGSTDATFTAGTRPVPGAGPTGGAHALAIAVQADGKLVLGGHCFSISGNLDFCLERLNADGSIDTTFNAAGTPGRVLRPVGASYDYGYRLIVQPDGKYVMAGYCNGAGMDFCAMRLNPDGSLDATFNTTGTLLLPVGSVVNGNDTAAALALQPDGKFVLAGYCSNGVNLDFCAVRINADGSLDTTFNSNGKLLVPVGTGDDYATAVAVQSDGKLLLSGYCSNAGNNDFCAVRLNSDGSLDKTFNPTGTPGKVTYAIAAGHDYATSIVVQPDGKVVVAGYCSPDTLGSNPSFCAIRLEGGPYGAQQCRMDIDGDGKVLATTDALIQTRIALGLRGSAVTNGISFPAGATRTSWTAIRNYLVTQCGMEL